MGGILKQGKANGNIGRGDNFTIQQFSKDLNKAHLVFHSHLKLKKNATIKNFLTRAVCVVAVFDAYR